MRNPKFLKTGPEFYKTQIYLENYLLILTNIQTWVNYRLYSQDLANLVQENIGFNFKTVYQMFRFRTRFLPESRKSWRVFLIILCLILYENYMQVCLHKWYLYQNPTPICQRGGVQNDIVLVSFLIMNSDLRIYLQILTNFTGLVDLHP